jgi:hypothetical protein
MIIPPLLFQMVAAASGAAPQLGMAKRSAMQLHQYQEENINQCQPNSLPIAASQLGKSTQIFLLCSGNARKSSLKVPYFHFMALTTRLTVPVLSNILA